MAESDVVVHHVKAAPAAPIESLTDDDIAAQYDAEAYAALRVLQEGRANGATCFVFVLPDATSTTTRAAVEAVRVLMLGAARQWHDDGVTVNCVVGDGDLESVVTFLAGGSVSGQTIRVGGPEPGL